MILSKIWHSCPPSTVSHRAMAVARQSPPHHGVLLARSSRHLYSCLQRHILPWFILFFHEYKTHDCQIIKIYQGRAEWSFTVFFWKITNIFCKHISRQVFACTGVFEHNCYMYRKHGEQVHMYCSIFMVFILFRCILGRWYWYTKRTRDI